MNAKQKRLPLRALEAQYGEQLDRMVALAILKNETCVHVKTPNRVVAWNLTAIAAARRHYLNYLHRLHEKLSPIQPPAKKPEAR